MASEDHLRVWSVKYEEDCDQDRRSFLTQTPNDTPTLIALLSSGTEEATNVIPDMPSSSYSSEKAVSHTSTSVESHTTTLATRYPLISINSSGVLLPTLNGTTESILYQQSYSSSTSSAKGFPFESRSDTALSAKSTLPPITASTAKIITANLAHRYPLETKLFMHTTGGQTRTTTAALRGCSETSSSWVQPDSPPESPLQHQQSQHQRDQHYRPQAHHTHLHISVNNSLIQHQYQPSEHLDALDPRNGGSESMKRLRDGDDDVALCDDIDSFPQPSAFAPGDEARGMDAGGGGSPAKKRIKTHARLQQQQQEQQQLQQEHELQQAPASPPASVDLDSLPLSDRFRIGDGVVVALQQEQLHSELEQLTSSDLEFLQTFRASSRSRRRQRGIDEDVHVHESISSGTTVATASVVRLKNGNKRRGRRSGVDGGADGGDSKGLSADAAGKRPDAGHALNRKSSSSYLTSRSYEAASGMKGGKTVELNMVGGDEGNNGDDAFNDDDMPEVAAAVYDEGGVSGIDSGEDSLTTATPVVVEESAELKEARKLFYRRQEELFDEIELARQCK
jgi:hypothetical protein